MSTPISENDKSWGTHTMSCSWREWVKRKPRTIVIDDLAPTTLKVGFLFTLIYFFLIYSRYNSASQFSYLFTR